jgi:hypothetical protein
MMAEICFSQKKLQADDIPRHRWKIWGSAVMVAVIGGCAAFEIRPAEQKLYSVSGFRIHRDWIGWMKEHTQPNDVIACVPFPRAGHVVAYQGTTEWMFLQTQHGRPMVNGYSGFFPSEFLKLKTAMGQFPDSASIDLLRKHGVQYCVVLRRKNQREAIDRLRLPALRLTRVFKDDRAKIDIYRLE